MLAHMLDHFVFSSRRLGLITKGVAFAICAGSVIGTFWWFKGVAFGIDGPIAEHKGLLWRKVCVPP
jgi:dolichyl-phosphate-mannose-protein mannosyltransferase